MPAPKNLHKKKAADRRVSFGDRKPPTLEPPDPEHNISSSALDEIPAELTGNLEASSPAERRISSASAGDTSRSSEDHKTSQSLTLPTDQRVSTTSSRRNSLPAHRGSIGGASSTLNGRRSSNSTQSSGKRYSIVTEDGIVFSEACTSDDLVDNLTKQKMNMQLKNVTDRIADVNSIAGMSCMSRAAHSESVPFLHRYWMSMTSVHQQILSIGCLDHLDHQWDHMHHFDRLIVMNWMT